MSLVSGNISIDALVYSSWRNTPGTAVSLSYSFLQAPPAGANAEDRNGFLPMTSGQRDAVRAALELWANVANLTFAEVGSGGNLQFGTNSQSGSSGYAYLPGTGYKSVSMYLNNNASYNTVFTPGSYGPSVLLHEIGHMLGLKHPGNYDSTGDALGSLFLPAQFDNGDYSLMSYTNATSTRYTGKYALTPMLYDVQAAQYLYGANMSYHAGDDIYRFTARDAPVCIWDAGGNNTFDFSACTGQVTIDLRAGGFSATSAGYHNIALAYGVYIGTAIAGNGGSVIYSSERGATIIGGNGADYIYAGAGDDLIRAGAGNDTVAFARAFEQYVVQRRDGYVLVLGEGNDRLEGVEVLAFSDRTVLVADLALAGAHIGSAGNDLLYLAPGNEDIDGGAGRDTVVVAGSRANYTVAAVAGGFRLTDLGGNGGVDYLRNVEVLHFRDMDISLEVDGIGGQAYRLYQAAFNRTPDLAGLGYWLGVMADGVPLGQVAGAFVQSPEFLALYGALDNAGFTAQIYRNVLHREPDSAGLDWYLARLNEGALRADVLASFSESPENQVQVIGAIQNGIEFLPYA